MINPLIFLQGMARGWHLFKYYLGCVKNVMFEKIVIGIIAVVIIASAAITV
jgi:hypothetical protein